MASPNEQQDNITVYEANRTLYRALLSNNKTLFHEALQQGASLNTYFTNERKNSRRYGYEIVAECTDPDIRECAQYLYTIESNTKELHALLESLISQKREGFEWDNGTLEKIEELLQGGADISARPSFGISCYELLLQLQDNSVVELLYRLFPELTPRVAPVPVPPVVQSATPPPPAAPIIETITAPQTPPAAPIADIVTAPAPVPTMEVDEYGQAITPVNSKQLTVQMTSPIQIFQDLLGNPNPVIFDCSGKEVNLNDRHPHEAGPNCTARINEESTMDFSGNFTITIQELDALGRVVSSAQVIGGIVSEITGTPTFKVNGAAPTA
ncbi:MAG: hypothetical protein K0R63_423 [Rickettsiales bacterium]|jgi:hypothetical protein|nr:hypothetical protein [Rickettsiales bacterium]